MFRVFTDVLKFGVEVTESQHTLNAVMKILYVIFNKCFCYCKLKLL